MDLTGRLLIAMPGMTDPRFEKSVVFICAHSDEGAMGMIINKPLPTLSFGDLLARMEIKDAAGGAACDVYFGGPVDNSRGFVLHSADYQIENLTLAVDETFGMTATRDVLEAITNGTGPKAAMLMLGYAGWGSGQLESELAQNGWLVSDANAELVFATDPQLKWSAALKTLGVDALTLSATAGRA